MAKKKIKKEEPAVDSLSMIKKQVAKKYGDVVKKGDPLLQLKDKEFSERVKQANAGYQITLAQSKFHHYQNILRWC